MKYPQSVGAARAVGMDRKALAEALYAEIPPRPQGRVPKGTKTVPELLAEAAAEIKRETGEDYTVGTLTEYREVAAWVVGNTGGHPPISWADASWTAHVEAHKKRLPWAKFVGGARTKRAVRVQAGALTGDVPAAARAITNDPAEATNLVKSLPQEALSSLQAAVNQEQIERHPSVTQKPPETAHGKGIKAMLSAQNAASNTLTQPTFASLQQLRGVQAALAEHYPFLDEFGRVHLDEMLTEVLVVAESIRADIALAATTEGV